MIDREIIVENVEKYINCEIEKPTVTINSQDNDLDRYMKRTAIRLLNTFEKYLMGSAGQSDYLCDLRNFMLVYKTFLQIDNTDILTQNHFGIKYDENINKFYATEELPGFTNTNVVLNGFVNKDLQLPQNNNKYLLETNPFIYKLTGFKRFKTIEQKLCVYGSLNTPKGFTTLVSMPTGGGKSLITQTVAYQEEGLTIVVVPTVSLAIDQQKAARENIAHDTTNEVFCYYGGIATATADAIFTGIKDHTARLLFISPEALLLNERFRKAISLANEEKYLKNIIIDEAHIVIAWGDYFRVDYQCLEPWRKQLIKNNTDLRTFLLSATFTDYTVKNLKSMFSSKEKWLEIRCDSLRKEPRFNLIKCDTNRQKGNYLLELVNKLPHPMIVYVNSPFDAERWKSYLNRYEYYNVQTFTGDTSSSDRDRLIKEWKNDEFDTMIATSAFGVGVSKPDVRTVLHLYIPESPDAYYQELGRGGRDGLPCLSVMCINAAEDIKAAFNRITKVMLPETMYDRWWTMLNDSHNSHSGSTIDIDTSVKPDHTRTGVIASGTKQDSIWNINLLLLLRRYNAIGINSITQNQLSEKYQIVIELLSPDLLKQEDAVIKLFSDIRSKEVSRSLAVFKRLENAIYNSDSVCWSEMFYEEYPLVSEYCSGCNYCGNKSPISYDQFPLLNAISSVEDIIGDNAKALFGNDREALIILGDKIDSNTLLQIAARYEANIMIINHLEYQYDYLLTDTTKATFNIMNYREFYDLQKTDNYYYLSGLVIAVYDDASVISDQFRLVKKQLSTNNGYILHIAAKDYEITSLGKKISEMINGSTYYES